MLAIVGTNTTTSTTTNGVAINVTLLTISILSLIGSMYGVDLEVKKRNKPVEIKAANEANRDDCVGVSTLLASISQVDSDIINI